MPRKFRGIFLYCYRMVAAQQPNPTNTKPAVMYENNFEGALEMFKKTIYSLFPLPESDFEKLSNVLHYKKYNKGDVILTEGKVCRHFWYILNGCFRMFSTETGLEVNVHFYFEGSLATDFISL